MSETIYVGLKNQVDLIIDADASTLYDLKEHFTFWARNYKRMPKYKAGIWDGRISVFKIQNRTLPAGLFERLQEFAANPGRDYTLELVDGPQGLPGARRLIDPQELFDFIQALDLRDAKGKPIEVYDYQFAGVHEGLSAKRKILVSPTATGKSLMMYILLRWWQAHDADVNRKFVIIVPTTALVEQLYGDFRDYSQTIDWTVEDEVQRIYTGKEKYTHHPVVITTWQSLVKYDKKFFGQIDAIIGDEAHKYSAETVQGIMRECHSCQYRWGMTGTLDDSIKINEMSLVGAFGERMQVTTTREQIDKGRLSQCKINVIKLKYLKEERRGFKKKYQDELAWIELHEGRNAFITNLLQGLSGNTLVVFWHREHGAKLEEMFRKATKDTRPTYYIDGTVDTEDRDSYRKEINESNGAVLFGSYETCSTGINIRNLHNLVFVAPRKAMTSVLQTLGRLLRLSDDGSTGQVYDIVDDLQSGKTANHTLRHGLHRLSLYAAEEHDYTVYEVNLEMPFE